jgi:hypothetical protein
VFFWLNAGVATAAAVAWDLQAVALTPAVGQQGIHRKRNEPRGAEQWVEEAKGQRDGDGPARRPGGLRLSHIAQTCARAAFDCQQRR